MRNGTDISLTDWQTNASMESETATELSFEQAFDQHHRLIYRYAAALTRDAGLAEDVVQEVFVRLYQNFDDARRKGMMRAWLLKVTVNTARNVLRGRSRAQLRDESFAERSLQIVESESPDEALQRRTEIEAARNALAKLKEPMRSCLLLRHEGLSYKEIAEALDVREANVGSLIARARREFIRVYGKIGKS